MDSKVIESFMHPLRTACSVLQMSPWSRDVNQALGGGKISDRTIARSSGRVRFIDSSSTRTHQDSRMMGSEAAAYRYCASHPVRLINDAFEQAQHQDEGVGRGGRFFVCSDRPRSCIDQVIRPDRNEINMSGVRSVIGAAAELRSSFPLEGRDRSHSLFLQLFGAQRAEASLSALQSR